MTPATMPKDAWKRSVGGHFYKFDENEQSQPAKMAEAYAVAKAMGIPIYKVPATPPKDEEA